MKKSFLLSLAFLALYLPAQAQLSFGIKGSVTKAWHSEDPSGSSKMKGLSTTLMLYKRVNKFLAFGMEPGVVQRGTSQQYDQNYYYPYYFICCFGDCGLPYYSPNGSSSGLKATYIQLPISARATLPFVKGKLALTGKFGGGPSWLASGYYDTMVYDESTFGSRQESKALDFSAENSPNRLDWGLYSGAGFGVKLSGGMLTCEMEYYHGLRDVMDYASIKNRSISYSLGYSINL